MGLLTGSTRGRPRRGLAVVLDAVLDEQLDDLRAGDGDAGFLLNLGDHLGHLGVEGDEGAGMFGSELSSVHMCLSFFNLQRSTA